MMTELLMTEADNPKRPCGLAPATGSASRLWRVTVEYELIVMADDEREAESEGEYYAGEDGSEPGIVVAHQIRKVEEIPKEWRQSIPFGGDRDDERTCVERVTPNVKS